MPKRGTKPNKWETKGEQNNKKKMLTLNVHSMPYIWQIAVNVRAQRFGWNAICRSTNIRFWGCLRSCISHWADLIRQKIFIDYNAIRHWHSFWWNIDITRWLRQVDGEKKKTTRFVRWGWREKPRIHRAAVKKSNKKNPSEHRHVCKLMLNNIHKFTTFRASFSISLAHVNCPLLSAD